MKTEKSQNTTQGCTETFGSLWTAAAAAGSRWRFQRQLNPATPTADTTKTWLWGDSGSVALL